MSTELKFKLALQSKMNTGKALDRLLIDNNYLYMFFHHQKPHNIRTTESPAEALFLVQNE